MSAGEIIKRTLSDGCACRRWHACISSVSLHHKENRLAHEQKPNNSSSRWKGSPFGEVGWLRDSGMRESVGHLLHYSTRPNEFWSRDGTTRKHTESLESHLTTPDAPISQMTTKKSDLDHFALSLSLSSRILWNLSHRSGWKSSFYSLAIPVIVEPSPVLPIK